MTSTDLCFFKYLQCLLYALRQAPANRIRQDIFCNCSELRQNESLTVPITVPMKHFYWLVADRHLWDGLDPIVISEGNFRACF